MWQFHDIESKKKKKLAGGYWGVYYPEHPFNNGGYMLIHRLVMENYLERYLDPEKEVVHHINEIKTCNFIWNLLLTSSSEHAIIHRMGKKHSKSGKKRMSQKHQIGSKLRKRNSSGQFQ